MGYPAPRMQTIARHGRAPGNALATARTEHSFMSRSNPLRRATMDRVGIHDSEPGTIQVGFWVQAIAVVVAVPSPSEHPSGCVKFPVRRRDELRAAGLAEPDVVIECTGNPHVWAAAPSLTRVGGKAMLFGGLTGHAQVSFSAKRIHYDEVTLLGSFHYTPADVAEAYRLLANGELKLGGLITDVRPLSSLPQAFDELERGEAIKFALRPEAHHP